MCYERYDSVGGKSSRLDQSADGMQNGGSCRLCEQLSHSQLLPVRLVVPSRLQHKRDSGKHAYEANGGTDGSTDTAGVSQTEEEHAGGRGHLDNIDHGYAVGDN